MEKKPETGLSRSIEKQKLFSHSFAPLTHVTKFAKEDQTGFLSFLRALSDWKERLRPKTAGLAP